VREGDAARRACRRLFGFSILYLFAIFAAIIVERVIGGAAFAPVIG
jgi:protoheme IX farnesyltransferase